MKKSKLFSWILVITWMAFIYFLSSQPASESIILSSGITNRLYNLLILIFSNIEIDVFHIFIRKSAHFIIYLILGILLMNATYKNNNLYFKNILIALLVSILYAVTDEIHQLFVLGRAGQLIDVFIDTTGSIVGVFIFNILHKITFHRREKYEN